MLLTRRQLLLLVILTLCWGINWPVMKMALSGITPLFYRAITMGGGSLILAGWLYFSGVKLKVTWVDLGKIFWLTLPNIIGWHVFSIYGVSELASGRASILGFTMPIWTALLGALILGQRLSPRIWISIVAVAAAVALLSFNEISQITGSPIGIVWMQIAAFSWALGTVLFGKIKPQNRIEVTTAWMLLMGALIIGTIALFTEPLPTFDYNGAVWFAIAYGLVINFGIGQLIWFSMASSLPPSASAFSVMTIPLVSIFFAAILTHEMPHLADFIAVGCIIIAIASAVLVRKPAVLDKKSDDVN